MIYSKKDILNKEKYMYSHRRNNPYQHQYNDHHKPLTRRNRRNSNIKCVLNARNWNMITYSGLWNTKTPTMPANVKEDPTLKRRRHPHLLPQTPTHHPHLSHSRLQQTRPPPPPSR